MVAPWDNVEGTAKVALIETLRDVLRAIKTNQMLYMVPKHLEYELRANGLFASIEEILEVSKHPCPQNRTESQPFMPTDEGMACWFDERKYQTCEPLGLLALTELNHPPALRRSLGDKRAYYPGQQMPGCTVVDRFDITNF